MKDLAVELGVFFDEYARRFNRALQGEIDVDAMCGAFAEHFIEASPRGITAGSNTEAFKEALTNGVKFYQSIGIRSMDVLSKKVILLDAMHAAVRIHWRSVYSKSGEGDGNVEFDVIYMIQDRGTEKKIFAYVTGDEQKVLQDLGIIPAAADINQMAG